MKAGDIVSVMYRSYSMVLCEGELGVGGEWALVSRIYKVLAMGGAYPTDNAEEDLPEQSNDCMLIDVDDSDFILFTQERFCRAVPTAPPDTMEVTVPTETTRIVLHIEKE